MDKCPFCGGEAEIDFVNIDGNGEKNYYVRCKSCAAEGGWGRTETMAIKYWNLRYVPTKKSDE